MSVSRLCKPVSTRLLRHSGQLWHDALKLLRERQTNVVTVCCGVSAAVAGYCALNVVPGSRFIYAGLHQPNDLVDHGRQFGIRGGCHLMHSYANVIVLHRDELQVPAGLARNRRR